MQASEIHDFCNNALKIEIIHKIIEDNLKSKVTTDPQITQDLLQLFEMQTKLLNGIEQK